VNSKTTREFWKLFYALPVNVQQLAYKNYLLWQTNPRHGSLRFKPIRNRAWSVRIGERYRAVGRFVTSDTFLWTWIGTHEDYNKL
jgi:hypothetical protein